MDKKLVAQVGRTVLLLGCALVPHASLAWSGYNSVTVISAAVYQNGMSGLSGALIRVSPITPSDTEGCTNSGTGYVWIDWSSTAQPDGKSLYASMLAAELAGKVVNLGVNGCSSNGYPLAYAVGVNQ